MNSVYQALVFFDVIVILDGRKPVLPSGSEVRGRFSLIWVATELDVVAKTLPHCLPADYFRMMIEIFDP